jgi:hypothetical protein
MTELQKLTKVYDELDIRYRVRDFDGPFLPEGVPEGTPVARVLEHPWTAEMLFDEGGNYLGTAAGDELGYFCPRGEGVEEPATEGQETASSFAERLEQALSGPQPPPKEALGAIAQRSALDPEAWTRGGRGL